MKRFFLLMATAAFCFASVSCESDCGHDCLPWGGRPVEPPIDPTPSRVYVAGTAYGADFNFIRLWIDGEAHDITNGTRSDVFSATATSVFVTDAGVVYIAGYEIDMSTESTTAKLWVDGVGRDLNQPFGLVEREQSRAESVFVSEDGTVYVAGYELVNGYYTATLWEITYDSGSGDPSYSKLHLYDGDYDSYANAVFVSDGTVYIAGTVYGESGVTVKLWENIIGGSGQDITDGTSYAEVRSLFVSGSDIYIAGGQSNDSPMVATVWVNGVATPLTDGNYWAIANSVFVSGTDVYAAGSEQNGTQGQYAKLWKNYEEAMVYTDGENQASAESVYVYDGDVYVTGWEDTYAASYFRTAKLWVNDNDPIVLEAAEYGASPAAVFVK